MKKTLRAVTCVLFICLTFNQAIASSVRVNTLGNLLAYSDSAGDQSQLSFDGSMYYRDDRNIHHNPAEVVYLKKNFLHFQKEEGTFIRKNKRTFWGLNYGKEDSEFGKIETRLGGYSVLATTDNNNRPLTLFWAKAGRTSYGTSLTYYSGTGKQTGGNEEEISIMKLNVGMSKKNWDLFLNYYVKRDGLNSDATQEKFAGGSKADVGFKMRRNKYKYYGLIKTDSYEYDTSATATNEFASMDIHLGLGRELKSKKKGLNLIYGAGFRKYADEDKATSSTTEVSLTRIPVHFALEYKIWSWLKLRAGAVYSVMNSKTTKTSTGESTESSPGLSGPQLGGAIKHKNLEIDFRYSNGYDQGVNNVSATEETSGGIEKLGELALIYKW